MLPEDVQPHFSSQTRTAPQVQAWFFSQVLLTLNAFASREIVEIFHWPLALPVGPSGLLSSRGYSQLAASPSWVVGKLSHQGDVLLHHCDSSSVSSTFLTVLKKINDARFCRTLKASQSIFSHRNLSISGWDGGGLGGKPAYGTAVGIFTSPDGVREGGKPAYGTAVGIFTSPDGVREGEASLRHCGRNLYVSGWGAGGL